jgi:O-antigen/teichoic acid export membrane protein
MKKSIVNDLGKVLAGNVGGQIIGLVRGLVVPLLVTPAGYGLWRILLLVWQYGVYLHLGSFALLNRDLPGFLAREAHGRVSEIRQTAFWGAMATASLVAIGLGVFSMTPASGADFGGAWALRISAIGLVAQQVFLYLMVDFRVHSQFGRMSLLGFCQAVAALVFMIPLGYVAGVPGFASGMTLATVLAVAAFGRRSAFEPPKLDLRAFLGQAARGIPLSGLPFLNTTITSVGQIVAAAILGLEATGFYGLGVMIGTFVYAIPRALGMVLYPRYLESVAVTEDPTDIGILLRRSIAVTSVMGTLTVCGIAVFLDPIYRYVFPSYLSALGSSYALLAMMPTLSYALVLQNALLALRLHRRAIFLQLGFIALSTGLSLTGAFVFGDVKWVALGVMVANTGYGLGAMWLALSATRQPDRNPLREILFELRPALVMGSVTIAMVVLWMPADELSSRVLVSLGQLLVLSPAAVFFGLRLLRARRTMGGCS